MSKEELVSCYIAGRISRRMFVRGLVTTGVSLTAAVAYSDVLAGARGGPMQRVGGSLHDQYPVETSPPEPSPEPSPDAAGASAAPASGVISAPRLTG